VSGIGAYSFGFYNTGSFNSLTRGIFSSGIDTS